MTVKSGYYKLDNSYYHIDFMEEQEDLAGYAVVYKDWAGKKFPQTIRINDTYYGNLGYIESRSLIKLTKTEFQEGVIYHMREVVKKMKTDNTDYIPLNFRLTEDRRKTLKKWKDV